MIVNTISVLGLALLCVDEVGTACNEILSPITRLYIHSYATCGK